MMKILNFLRKPIVLDFYTSRPDVFRFSKPAPASQFLPEWWKSLPLTVPYKLGETSTMKRCVGFIEYYKKGVMLPLWSDLAIRIGVIGSFDYEWKFSDGSSTAVIHDVNEHAGFCPRSHHAQIKLGNPWIARCSEDIPWLFTQPDWNFNESGDVRIPNGVLEFKHQHGLNINMFISHESQEKYIRLNHGQPMGHLIPLTERRVVYRHHLVSQQELDRIHVPQSITFTKIYKTKKELSKCPFNGAIK
jgi:hypothetical protein